MFSTQHYKRFLVQFGLATLAGAAVAVALVVCIDPYGLYGLVDQPGLNRVKPQLRRYQKEIKTELAFKAGADTFIIGNSRAEIGFDPQHPALAAGTGATYNLALAGSRIGSAREQLSRLRARGKRPARLLVGVEFLDFLVKPQAPLRPETAPAPAFSALADLQWRLDAAFSIDSVADALATLRLQHMDDPESMTARGFNPFHDHRKLARDEGYYPLFQQRAGDYARRFAARAPALRSEHGQAAIDLDHLRSILTQAAADGADVHVAIYPYHAQILAMFEQAGMMPAFEQWKVMLAAEIDAIRAARRGARITLWDFSGYLPYQCEAIPARGDRKGTTAWYWEAGHFKSALGDRMLDRMFAQPAADGADGFGVRLGMPQVSANQQRMARERAVCAGSAPRLFEDAAALVARSRPAS